MFGQTPFLGVGMIEFDAPAEGLRVDTRLLEGEGEPASHYVAVAANADAVPLGYALVQVPFAPLEARLRAGQEEREGASDGRRDLYERRLDEAERKARARLDEAEGRISELRRRLDDAIVQSESAMRIARAQGEEIEDLRARLRRTNEDRAELEGELGKLRRALADADASVMALTRRTAEEMTAVAERLSVSLRAPEEIHAGKAYMAEVASLRDHAEELRVRLAETESRAGAAERRLEETATAARDREHETADLRARLRRAEDAVERERLAVQTLQEQARIAGAEIEQLAARANALHDRDERIARLEGEKQDLAWRTAELEEKLRTAISRAVSAEAARGAPGMGGPMLAPVPPPCAAGSARARARLSTAGGGRAGAGARGAGRGAYGPRSLDRGIPPRGGHAHRRGHAPARLGQRAVGAGDRARGVAARGRDARDHGGQRCGDAAQERARAGRGRSRAPFASGRARGQVAAPRAREEGGGAGRRRSRGARAQAAGGRDRARDVARRAGAPARARRRARGRAARGRQHGHDVVAPPWSRELSEELAGIEAGLRKEMRTLVSLEAALGESRAPGHPASVHGAPAANGEETPVAASRLENTLANFRRRAQQLRDELNGYRWRVESLSASEISILLDELGEGLSEFEA